MKLVTRNRQSIHVSDDEPSACDQLMEWLFASDESPPVVVVK